MSEEDPFQQPTYEEYQELATKAVDGLMKHFDCVQVIGIIHLGDKTISVSTGAGNFYARESAMREFVLKNEERNRVSVWDEEEEEDGEEE